MCQRLHLSWGQRRRISSLILETKKEDLLEGQFADAGDKEGGLARRPVRLSWGQRRRTCRRASSLVLGTKKEDLLEGQACPEVLSIMWLSGTSSFSVPVRSEMAFRLVFLLCWLSGKSSFFVPRTANWPSGRSSFFVPVQAKWPRGRS